MVQQFLLVASSLFALDHAKLMRMVWPADFRLCVELVGDHFVLDMEGVLHAGEDVDVRVCFG